MSLRQTTSPQREWGIRRLLLPLFVCLLAMVAGQSRAQNVTAEDVRQWRQAAEQGDAAAQYNLGLCYYNGWSGVTQNYYEAVKWYRKAAEQGVAKAQYNLGNCYCFGEGVTQNYTEAVKWYRKAAEQGLAPAQCNLGVCYKKGNGVAQNYTEAVKWYRKAAEQGYAVAQYNLGYSYCYAEGVTQSYAEAAKWYRKAAEQGHAKAKENLELISNLKLTDAQPEDESDTGMDNGHEWVDLGLSVKWATCNVGASSPGDYGDYFAWGETSQKNNYLPKHYEHNKNGKYQRIGKNISGKQYDAARANWGGTWRMPTLKEYQELNDKCTWTWVTQDGRQGYRVTGPNGNSIFLPAAGFRRSNGAILDRQGTYGFYWSATSRAADSNFQAHIIRFLGGIHYCDYFPRFYGLPIRPVTE